MSFFKAIESSQNSIRGQKYQILFDFYIFVLIEFSLYEMHFMKNYIISIEILRYKIFNIKKLNMIFFNV